MRNITRVIILFILGLTVIMLGGCTGSAYNSSDKKKLESEGRERLEEYFAEYLPEAELLSVEAVSANREMTLTVLTNYVKGEYSDQGQRYEYYFDVINRRLFTSDKYYRFKSKVEDKVLKDLGLYELYRDEKLTVLFSDINIYLPDMAEFGAFNTDVGNEAGKLPPADSVMPYYAPVFPIEAVEDPEAYISDQDRKEIIDVSLTLAVDASENTDLNHYTFAELYYAPKDENIFYRYLCIHNALSVTYPYIGHGAEPEIISKETLKAVSQGIGLRNYNISYELWDDVNPEESEKHGIIYKRTEELDTDTGNITTNETDYNLSDTAE